MPVNLSRFEFAKGIILVEKLLVSAIFLALLISISNIIAPATAVYSLLHSITGSIGIILASVWQILWDSDGTTDHVGLVERVENGRVYTVEGNSGDMVRQSSYPIGDISIYGYGVPNY